jgi:DNA repair protein RecO (recombination protein O)
VTARRTGSSGSAGGRKLTVTHHTAALLLGRIEQGDNNLILSLFTEKLGRVSALARHAKNSRRRFGGSLEPMHTLSVVLDEAQAELLGLREAELLQVRTTLTSSLTALQCAGQALRWIKHAAPLRTPEPIAWRLILQLLDALDSPRSEKHEKALHSEQQAQLLLARCGLQLLGAFGWGLELDRCVRCGRACPIDKKAYVNPSKGGLICRQCGMAKIVLSGAQRQRLAATARGELAMLQPEDCEIALDLVEQCLAAHAHFTDN